MKRYLICSDIHGKIENFKKALKEANLDPLDGVIIAGDLEYSTNEIWNLVTACDSNGRPSDIYMVKGNCDGYETSLRDLLTFDLPGVRCLLTHGHKYHVKNELDLLSMIAMNNQANLVIYGHTHEYDDHMMGRIRFLNPGSIGINHFGKPSYMLMTIDNGRIEVIKREITRD